MSKGRGAESGAGKVRARCGMQARNEAAGLTGKSLIQCSPKGQMMTAAQCWSSSALSAQHAAACYPHRADLEANLDDENHRCSSKMIHIWQQTCDTRRWQPAFQQRCDTRWVPLSRAHHISSEPQDHRAPLARCTSVQVYTSGVGAHRPRCGAPEAATPHLPARTSLSARAGRPPLHDAPPACSGDAFC